jgi:hypothetical protein
MIRAEGGLAPPDARDQAIAFYISVIRDDAADLKLKLEAQQRLDTIYGIDAAPKWPVGPDGSPAVPQVNVRAVQVALGDERGRELLAQLAEHAAGLDAPPDVPPAVAERMNGNPLPPGPAA